LQYEIDKRKAGISNQSYEGVNQAWLRGMAHYNSNRFLLIYFYLQYIF
jgi:hypothetical protein